MVMESTRMVPFASPATALTMTTRIPLAWSRAWRSRSVREYVHVAQLDDSAWKRLEITYDPVSASLVKSAEDAYSIGFLKKKPDLSRIYELKLLNEVLRERGLPEVK